MFQTPSTIQKISTLADQTIRLTVDCQELPAEEMTELFKLRNTLGWFLFKENPIVKEDVPEETAPEFKEDKSPSKQLRDHLFVYWKNNTNMSIEFDTFWKKWVAKKCQEIKDLLP
jgi:hypothetical protein